MYLSIYLSIYVSINLFFLLLIEWTIFLLLAFFCFFLLWLLGLVLLSFFLVLLQIFFATGNYTPLNNNNIIHICRLSNNTWPISLIVKNVHQILHKIHFHIHRFFSLKDSVKHKKCRIFLTLTLYKNTVVLWVSVRYSTLI